MDGSPSTADGQQRQLVFRIGDQHHEIDAGMVLEIVKVPSITRVPHGPSALAGLANLRGKPVPVLSMGKILNADDTAARQTGKIIVYSHGGPVGLLVDDVIRLSAGNTATPLQGLGELLDAAFQMAKRGPTERRFQRDSDADMKADGKLTALLSFRVADQLCGIPLDHIREVVTLVGDIATMPNAPNGVLGVVPMRESVVTLVSLADLLGLENLQMAGKGSRVIVVEYADDLIGIVVDEIDVIRRLPEHAIDAVPAVLQKGRGDAQIEAIGRVAESGLLMSILLPEKLFGHHAVAQAISQNTGAKPMETTREEDDAIEQFLIFQLADENYALPIAAVDEVIRVPNEVTRMPGAPSFVTGVTNLRGKPIPLIDQRTRFEISTTAQTAKARAIIVTIGTLQAGFVVDGVSEVKAVSSASVSTAPVFSSDQTDVFDRIAHIEADGRMILVIDPKELLTRAEQDIVAALAADKPVVAAP